MENEPATKKDLEAIHQSIADLTKVVKDGFTAVKKDIRYIHEDLTKHDERTNRLIKLVKGEPLEEEEAGM